MKDKIICENRNKRQISYLLQLYFTYDVLCVISACALFISIFLSFFAPGKIWFKIALICLFSIPVIIRTILTIILNKKLCNNPSKTIVINNPVSKVLTTRRGGDYILRGLRIKGEYNGRKIRLFEYPLKESIVLMKNKEKKINGKSQVKVTIIEGTHVINSFYEEKKLKRTKQSIKTYRNFSTEKEKKFKFEPLNIEKEDLILYLNNSYSYDELYLLSNRNTYVILKVDTTGEKSDKYISIDKLEINDTNKAIEWLEDNGFIYDNNLTLLAIIDLNDPNGFIKELESIRE